MATFEMAAKKVARFWHAKIWHAKKLAKILAAKFFLSPPKWQLLKWLPNFGRQMNRPKQVLGVWRFAPEEFGNKE